jgi:hypothetical protein
MYTALQNGTGHEACNARLQDECDCDRDRDRARLEQATHPDESEPPSGRVWAGLWLRFAY